MEQPEKDKSQERRGSKTASGSASNCKICKRPLSNYMSVKLGIGPVCRSTETLQPGLPFENHAEFKVQTVNEKFIYLEDIGHEQVKTVTNDVKTVLQQLQEDYDLKQLRIFYKDSEGEIDEILHYDGVFKDFRQGHKGFTLEEIMGQSPIQANKKKQLLAEYEQGR